MALPPSSPAPAHAHAHDLFASGVHDTRRRGARNRRPARLALSCLRAVILALAVPLGLMLAFGGSALASCQLLAGGDWITGAAPVHLAALERDQVGITYIGHATFELETPTGVRIATDYNNVHRPARLPRVITMNGAHSTHFTLNPDPDIEHVLFGWNPDGGPMDHDLTVGDVRIRNLQTNIRGWDGETRRLGNSIFVFEVADLCIAHLGHLHHRLTQDDLARLGTIDIVFAPVDNASTLRLDSLVEVIKAVSPRIVIPMHAYTYGSRESFTARMASEGFRIETSASPLYVASRAALPAEQTVLVLPER
ncbi:MBL fold metallo-hydrolase [Stappia sp. MMSF_3263]|uniref:MBL fold metallo-hydrolase n=1 Tax=Stappia sp. MMSF_3263 TaxID=3046693 RepID=UPI00273DE859|nr:MBL fold metallo-hydrolase [Stappia sp. MMSF_3263]